MEGRTEQQPMMQIPYGMMNFVAIREDNYYYVDKTRFIEKKPLSRFATVVLCAL